MEDNRQIADLPDVPPPPTHAGMQYAYAYFLVLGIAVLSMAALTRHLEVLALGCS